MQVNRRIRLAGIEEDGARARVGGTADEVKLAMQIVGAGVGDGVVDVAGGAAEFRGEAVGDGLYFAHVAVGDREQAKAVLVALGIGHAIQLILHAIVEPVGVHHARDAEFGVGVSADAGLEEYEVVRIARRQGQIVDLGLSMVRPVETREGSMTGAPPVTSTVVDAWRRPELGCRLRPSCPRSARYRPALGWEAFLLDGQRVGAERQVGNDEIAFVVRLDRLRYWSPLAM